MAPMLCGVRIGVTRKQCAAHLKVAPRNGMKQQGGVMYILVDLVWVLP